VGQLKAKGKARSELVWSGKNKNDSHRAPREKNNKINKKEFTDAFFVGSARNKFLLRLCRAGLSV